LRGLLRTTLQYHRPLSAGVIDRIDAREGARQTLVATAALLCCMAASTLASAQSADGRPETGAVPVPKNERE
jgi:hypothetical protein